MAARGAAHCQFAPAENPLIQAAKAALIPPAAARRQTHTKSAFGWDAYDGAQERARRGPRQDRHHRAVLFQICTFGGSQRSRKLRQRGRGEAGGGIIKHSKSRNFYESHFMACGPSTETTAAQRQIAQPSPQLPARARRAHRNTGRSNPPAPAPAP